VNETVAISDVDHCIALTRCFLERSHLMNPDDHNRK
jgi:hypothetical protein